MNDALTAVDNALATTIGVPPTRVSSLPVVRAESFRQDNEGDVLIKPWGYSWEVAVDDPLALLAVVLAAIKFGHGHEMLAAAQQLVTAFAGAPK